jgi:hypothetical protein
LLCAGQKAKSKPFMSKVLASCSLCSRHFAEGCQTPANGSLHPNQRPPPNHAARPTALTPRRVPTLPQLAVLPAIRGKAEAQVASAVKALVQHACGRSALAAAGAEAALAAAAESRQGAWAAPALAEALEMLRRRPEDGPGPGPLGGGPERGCSTECQRSSWAGHRAVCLERRAEAAAAAAAGSQQVV